MKEIIKIGPSFLSLDSLRSKISQISDHMRRVSAALQEDLIADNSYVDHMQHTLSVVREAVVKMKSVRVRDISRRKRSVPQVFERKRETDGASRDRCINISMKIDSSVCDASRLSLFRNSLNIRNREEGRKSSVRGGLKEFSKECTAMNLISKFEECKKEPQREVEFSGMFSRKSKRSALNGLLKTLENTCFNSNTQRESSEGSKRVKINKLMSMHESDVFTKRSEPDIKKFNLNCFRKKTSTQVASTMRPFGMNADSPENGQHSVHLNLNNKQHKKTMTMGYLDTSFNMTKLNRRKKQEYIKE